MCAAKRRWRWPKVGKSEVTFLTAVGILMSMTFSAVALGRPADPTLVAAAIGLIGVPVFLKADRKDDDDDPR